MPTRDQDDHRDEQRGGGREEFPTTHWTLVTRVRSGGEARRAALEELCGIYWYPIYAFVRRRGHGQHDAEDITQGFFAKLIQDETIEAADLAKGRLRTFLLGSLDRHMADQHRRQTAQKRGGGRQTIAFEQMNAEERYAAEPHDKRDPEWAFAQAWARLMLESAGNRLRATFEDDGRGQVYELLSPFLLLDDSAPPYKDVARQLGASETAVRLLVFRLRSGFRQMLREEVGRTVLTQGEIDQEIDWLKSVLAAK